MKHIVLKILTVTEKQGIQKFIRVEKRMKSIACQNIKILKSHSKIKLIKTKVECTMR